MWRVVPGLLWALLWTGALHAQYWANDIGGLGADAVNDVKADPSGNLYVTGEFSLSMTYDGQTIVSAGLADAFVAKLDASGALQWIVRAGGPGIDRGLKIAVNDAGTIVAACGQFSGTADLFGTSHTSAGGTHDVFTVKLDGATGATDWVRVGGAPLAADRPYGICIAPNGRIAVAGDFRGTADFDGSTITSAYDDVLLAPGFDAFIAVYQGTGPLDWLQQGTAPHADRAIDIVSDASNNFYVCGQFSDTITFDVVHNNTLTNASFLVKFDAAGNEQWFRRFGGATFQHVRDLQLTAGGELLLCGDLQGSMVYFDVIPDPIAATDPYAYFLLRTDLSGEHLSHATLGSASPLSVAALDQQGGKVCAYGTFTCQFSGLSSFYGGTGLFMATGPEDLFITRHDFPSFALTDAQQFGGQHAKDPGGLTSLPGGALVFGGGYSRLLVLPSDGGGWGDVQSVPAFCPLVSVNDGMTYCGSSNYGDFSANNAAGGTDGFVARAFVTGRPPYDAWNRYGSTGCDRSALEPCIMYEGGFPACPDTITLCSGGQLEVLASTAAVSDLAFSYWEDQSGGCDSTAYTGWDVGFLWSTGSTAHSIFVTTPGWYWCTTSATNGCWTWTDSVYVAFAPSTFPLISDAYGVNVAAAATIPLECVDPLWIWCPNVPPGYSVEWTGSVNNDSLYVTTSWAYTVTLTSPEGCALSNSLLVVIGDTSGLPNYTGVDVELDVPDTVVVCPNSLVSGTATLSWYLDGLPAPPDTSLMIHVTNGSNGYYAVMDDELTWFFQAFSNGWTVIDLDIEIMDPPCGQDTITFTIQDSLYVALVPWANSTVIAPSYICPGDTAPLALLCTGCSTINWAGPGIVAVSADEDTCWVNMPGIYSVNVSGSYMGLVCPTTEYLSIATAQPPPLYIDPMDGIVCPGDTAIIYTTYVAAIYQWDGPLGGVPGSNDSIFATEPGEYFLSTTSASGCELYNGPITLDNYGSPYIDASPDAALCPGDGPVLIAVVAAPGAVISWLPPLAGSSPYQTVSDTGTYSAWVTSCGNDYLVSVQITLGLNDVDLDDPGPFTVCDGDSVQLQGPGGMSSYLWWPGGETTSSIWISVAGEYALTAEDATGCAGTSDTTLLALTAVPGPVALLTDTICSGDTATLVASSAGSVIWYAWPEGSSVIGTGDQLTLGPLAGTDTVLVAQQIDGCEGPQTMVVVEVDPTPPPPVITGELTPCEGDSLVLIAGSSPGTVINWTTPAGASSGGTITIAPASVADGGTYSAIAMLGGCTGTPASVVVSVEPMPAAPTLSGDAGLCVGDALELQAAGPSGAQYLWSTPLGPGSGPVFSWAPVDLSASGTYVCIVVAGDCESQPAAIDVVVDPCDSTVFFPNVISPNGDGHNDLFELEGFGGEVNLRIFNRWGTLIAELTGRKVLWNGRVQANNELVSEGVYYWEAVVPLGDKAIRKAGYVQVIR